MDQRGSVNTRRRGRPLGSFVVACLLALLAVPATSAGAEANPVSYDFDGAELTFQASTGSPVVLAFAAGGSLSGTWDPVTGAFEGTLDVVDDVVVPRPFGVGLRVDLVPSSPAPASVDGPIPVSGNIPADGTAGELVAQIDLDLDFLADGDPFNSSLYRGLEITLEAVADPMGVLELHAAGFVGAPIDGCGGGGCGYSFKDLATEWGLPASLFIQDAQPYTWNNPGNDDNSFDLHFSGGPEWSFTDVPPGHPFFADIEWLASSGVTGGYADGTFRPAGSLTRQNMAAFLYRYVGSPAGPFPDPGFSDVPPSHQFFTAISWLAQSGITGGYADGTFRPAEPLSRQGMAAFLHRMAGSPAGPFPDPGFSDVPPSGFRTAIWWLAQSGITGGYDDGTFRPGGTLSRQGLAAFLHRYDALANPAT